VPDRMLDCRHLRRCRIMILKFRVTVPEAVVAVMVKQLMSCENSMAYELT
jgi:hypothetical protein